MYQASDDRRRRSTLSYCPPDSQPVADAEDGSNDGRDGHWIILHTTAIN